MSRQPKHESIRSFGFIGLSGVGPPSFSLWPSPIKETTLPGGVSRNMRSDTLDGADLVGGGRLAAASPTAAAACAYFRELSLAAQPPLVPRQLPPTTTMDGGARYSSVAWARFAAFLFVAPTSSQSTMHTTLSRVCSDPPERRYSR